MLVVYFLLLKCTCFLSTYIEHLKFELRRNVLPSIFRNECSLCQNFVRNFNVFLNYRLHYACNFVLVITPNILLQIKFIGAILNDKNGIFPNN